MIERWRVTETSLCWVTWTCEVEADGPDKAIELATTQVHKWSEPDVGECVDYAENIYTTEVIK